MIEDYLYFNSKQKKKKHNNIIKVVNLLKVTHIITPIYYASVKFNQSHTTSTLIIPLITRNAYQFFLIYPLLFYILLKSDKKLSFTIPI
jgi:hypothetical protein